MEPRERPSDGANAPRIADTRTPCSSGSRQGDGYQGAPTEGPAPASAAPQAQKEALLRAHIESTIEDARRVYVGLPSSGVIPKSSADNISTGTAYAFVPGKIYDGDTYTAGTKLMVPRIICGNAVVDEVTKKIRLYGYDAEEMRFPRTMDKDVAERRKDTGKYHKGLLVGLTRGPMTCVPVAKGVFDAYGRVVGVVFNGEGLCLNTAMLEHCPPMDPGFKEGKRRTAA